MLFCPSLLKLCKSWGGGSSVVYGSSNGRQLLISKLCICRLITACITAEWSKIDAKWDLSLGNVYKGSYIFQMCFNLQRFGAWVKLPPSRSKASVHSIKNPPHTNKLSITDLFLCFKVGLARTIFWGVRHLLAFILLHNPTLYSSFGRHFCMFYIKQNHNIREAISTKLLSCWPGTYFQPPYPRITRQLHKNPIMLFLNIYLIT